MKNYYEILGVAENAPTTEVVQKGRKLLEEYSVDRKFAGKQMGMDYTMDEWKEANNAYAQIIEAYQILKDENKRTEYNLKLRAYRRQLYQTQQQRAQQQATQEEPRHRTFYDQETDRSYRYTDRTEQTTNRNPRTGRYQGAHEQPKGRTQGAYERQRRQGAYEQSRRSQGAYATGSQRTQRYSKSHTDNTMERGHSRVRKEKGAVGKMIDSFKEVRQDEKAYTFFERHQDLNRNVRREYHKNVHSVPGEIVYQMANGTLHVTYEFIHQLKKLAYINEDSFPKYVFRNRKLAAAALAVAIMAGSNASDTNGMINIEQPPAVTITQETEVEDTTVMEQELMFEEPTIKMTQYYEVEKGDTLSEISTNSGIKVYEIQDANNRIGTDKIYIGETLILNHTIDREDLHYYTITIPAKGMLCSELAKQYRTDEETIIRLNKEAVAYINSGYTILTDTAVVPNFITIEQLDMMKQTATGHNY